MSVTPNPNDGEPTVVMPTQEATEASLSDILRHRAAWRRARRRRLALYATVGIGFVLGIGAGWLFFPTHDKRVAVTGQTSRDVAPPPVMPPAGPPASPPSPRPPDTPVGPRQMLNEIFEGRDRGLSVTALVDRGAVRIGSSRPGYVYVLAASASQSGGGALFAAVLFPRTPDTNNRVRPGQTLRLPDLRWPANAELLAIVSDERRDIDVLGPLVGKVICGSAGGCSEAYGAAFFPSPGASSEAARDTARGLVRDPAVQKAAPARPTRPVSRRCSDILERASLGESLTDEEQAYLRRDCR
jgi:hypothetical protein